MSNEIVQSNNNILSIQQLKERALLVKEALNSVMTDGEHYGIVPGCGKKPTLLKPGTEKLCMLFRLSPTFQITTKELPENHREYEVITTLTNIPTGEVWAQGVGCCSTKETKYCKRRDGSANPNPTDVFNTVLKMAKKRSQADAVLTATGASDIFTQDIEDMVENGTIQPKQIKPLITPIAPKFTELQPIHQQKYDDFCTKMQESIDEAALDAIYSQAKETFRVSTSLTQECINKTLDELKAVYDFCKSPEEPQDENK